MTADAAGRFPEVKSLVDQHIPKAWLRDAMPKVTARLESLTFVDHVFDWSLVGLSGVSVAVVAALLYDDANDALKAMGGDVSGKKRSPGPKPRSLPRLTLSMSSDAPPLTM